MVELTSLPAEVISHVACLGDTKSALAIAASCRRFREICYHPLTFKRLILTRLADPARGIHDPKVTAKYYSRLESRCSEVDDWARYSLIEDVLTRALAPKSADQITEFEAAIFQRLANIRLESRCSEVDDSARYSIIEDVWTRALAPKSADQTTEPEGEAANFQRLADCQWAILSAQHPTIYEIGCLEYIVASLKILVKSAHVPGIQLLKTLLPFLIAATLNGVSHTFDLRHWSDPSQDYEWNDELLPEQMIAKEDLNYIFQIIFNVADASRKGFFGSSILDLLPDYLGDGLPFASKVVANPSHHLQAGWYSQAINPHNIEFLTSGTWTGYNTCRWPPINLRFDEPMRNIRFRVTDSQGSHELEEVRAVGCSDKWGGFDICLSVMKQTGKFRAEKTYYSGLNWLWSGLVTPFGLVGDWGRWYWGQSGGPTGYVWLYKIKDDSISESTSG